jgi:hypothetical protein
LVYLVAYFQNCLILNSLRVYSTEGNFPNFHR